MEYSTAVTKMQVQLQRRPDGRMVLRLSSDRPINDPFVDLVIDATWGTGRITRSYTMLFDPPALRRPPVAVAAPAQITAPQTTAAAAPPPSAPPAPPQRPWLRRPSILHPPAQRAPSPKSTARCLDAPSWPVRVRRQKQNKAANPTTLPYGLATPLVASPVATCPASLWTRCWWH